MVERNGARQETDGQLKRGIRRDNWVWGNISVRVIDEPTVMVVQDGMQ